MRDARRDDAHLFFMPLFYVSAARGVLKNIEDYVQKPR